MNKKDFLKGVILLFTNPKKIANYFFSGKKSYSQSGEDIILSFLLDSQESGFYIDVGANHPKRLSNTLFFYKKGWNGINIEPNSILHKKFLRYRKRDLNLNIGIGPTKSESLDFYIINPDTLSTFDSLSAENYTKEGHEITEIRKVPVITLNEVFNKYVKEQVDFISIDTEGYDMEVLKTNDWDKNRPGFIILETLEYKKNGFGKKLNYLYDNFLESIFYYKYSDTYI